MYYAYNKHIGCIPCETKEEAIHMAGVDPETRVIESVLQELMLQDKIRPYNEYMHTYEAIILYIIHKANKAYSDYLTKKKIGEIFTITILRYYLRYRDSYTGEEPIRASKPRKYKGNIGFSKYEEYYDNIKTHLHSRKQGNWYVLSTEISGDILRALVDNIDMIHVVDSAVRDAKYPRNCKRIIKNLYKTVPTRYKKE